MVVGLWGTKEKVMSGDPMSRLFILRAGWTTK
jgi:hypothetical protein